MTRADITAIEDASLAMTQLAALLTVVSDFAVGSGSASPLLNDGIAGLSRFARSISDDLEKVFDRQPVSLT